MISVVVFLLILVVMVDPNTGERVDEKYSAIISDSIRHQMRGHHHFDLDDFDHDPDDYYGYNDISRKLPDSYTSDAEARFSAIDSDMDNYLDGIDILNYLFKYRYFPSTNTSASDIDRNLKICMDKISELMAFYDTYDIGLISYSSYIENPSKLDQIFV